MKLVLYYNFFLNPVLNLPEPTHLFKIIGQGQLHFNIMANMQLWLCIAHNTKQVSFFTSSPASLQFLCQKSNVLIFKCYYINITIYFRKVFGEKTRVPIPKLKYLYIYLHFKNILNE